MTNSDNPSRNLVVGICYASRKVLSGDEWTGWLQWMRNCFKYGTLAEHWKQHLDERWFHPGFQNFINKEVAPKPESKQI